MGIHTVIEASPHVFHFVIFCKHCRIFAPPLGFVGYIASVHLISATDSPEGLCVTLISFFLAVSNPKILKKNKRCYWLCFPWEAAPAHVGEQVRRQENNICSANNLPLRDHTKWFPICHTSYTPNNTITRLTHLVRWAATDIGFLPFSD